MSVDHRPALLFTALLLTSATAAPAAPPTVEYLYPAGAQQGATTPVTAGGKIDGWPLRCWADHPGIKVEPAAEKGKLNVTVDKAVPPGPHLVRFYDAQGASAPIVFVVGTLPEVAEVEPNDGVARAQAVEARPVTVNGRLEKSGDVDSYAVKLEAGQCLTASLLGRRIGAPMDPLLHLCDSSGNELAFAHDGLELDPLLVYRADKAGTYLVRVAAFKYPPAADVKLAGEAADVYRLTLDTAPPVRYAIPAGVRRGTKATIRLFRWGGNEPQDREVDATAAAEGDQTLALSDVGVECGLPVALSDGPELTEQELQSASQSAPLAAPVAVTGRIDRPGEEDGYRFAAKKDDRFVFSLQVAALASPMDAVLRVEDEAGKTLATNDDARGDLHGTGGDARLEWAAPGDGVYRAVVGDLYGNGGDAHVYRLSLRRTAPSFAATVDADEYRVAPGKTVAVKVNVSRAGGDGTKLVAVATGLPPGVTATAAEVPDKGGDVTLTLSAAADAKPASGPVRVMVLGTDPAKPAARAAAAALKKEAEQELIPRTDAVWLTVLPAP